MLSIGPRYRLSVSQSVCQPFHGSFSRSGYPFWELLRMPLVFFCKRAHGFRRYLARYFVVEEHVVSTWSKNGGRWVAEKRKFLQFDWQAVSTCFWYLTSYSSIMALSRGTEYLEVQVILARILIAAWGGNAGMFEGIRKSIWGYSAICGDSDNPKEGIMT